MFGLFGFRNLARLSLLSLALSQCSCVESEHPLVDPEKSAPDKRLFGRWKPADPKEKDEQFLVAPASNDAR